MAAASSSPHARPASIDRLHDGESYTLSVADADGGADDAGAGLEITARTTLKEVRDNFPVPAEFCFGVPLAHEALLLAKNFMPLTLLNGAEVPSSRLVPRPSQVAALKRQVHDVTNQLTDERWKRESAEAARDLLVREVDKMGQELQRARDTIEQLGRRRGEPAALAQATRRLSAAPAELRRELAALRGAVERTRTDAAAAVAGMGPALLAQLGAALEAADGAHLRRQQQAVRAAGEAHQSALLHARVELDELRARHARADEAAEARAALEGKLRAAEDALRESHEHHAMLQARLENLEAERDAQRDAERARPPAERKSGFGEYMRVSQLRRDAEHALQAGRELHGQPSSAAARDAFAAALSKLAAASASLVDGPPPPPPAPAPAFAAAAAPYFAPAGAVAPPSRGAPSVGAALGAALARQKSPLGLATSYSSSQLTRLPVGSPQKSGVGGALPLVERGAMRR